MFLESDERIGKVQNLTMSYNDDFDDANNSEFDDNNDGDDDDDDWKKDVIVHILFCH